MWRALEAIDAEAVTHAAIISHRASFEREMTDLIARIDTRHNQTRAA
jgi:hypothetical protein